MSERVLNLLSMCMQAKDRGHDAFFDYSPHVQLISIYGYVGGRIKDKDYDFEYRFYIDDLRAENMAKFDEVESFLKGLIV